MGDEKKRLALMHAKRLATLNILTAVDLMPHQQLEDFQRQLASLKSYASLTEKTLETASVCPECGFAGLPNFLK